MQKSTCLLLAAALVLALGACAPKVKTKALVPAKFHEATSLKRIAVMPLENDRGSLATAQIAAILADVRIAGKPYFDVVEREAMRQVVREQALGQTGVVDQTTAQQTGQMLGAEGIVMGAVTKNYVQDSPFTDTRSVCVRYDEDGYCDEYQSRRVSCLKRTAVFAFTPKIVNVQTGRIAAADTFEDMESKSVCETDGVSLPPGGVLLDKARTKALNEFRNAVAPRYITVEISLMKDDRDGCPEQAEDLIKQGVTWAKEGRLDRACGIWRQAYDIYPQSLAAPYNLGVCAETAGDTEGALKLYKEADRHAMEPEKLINEALTRVRQSQADQNRLRQQMEGRI